MEKINKIAESLIIKKALLYQTIMLEYLRHRQAKNHKLLNEQNCDCFVFPECVELPY